MGLLSKREFRALCEDAHADLITSAPNPKTRFRAYYINRYGKKVRGSTGNLAYNSITKKFTPSGNCVIFVDESIAPYMPYTNEPWLSARWKGHKNPNEGWFDRAALKIAENIAKSLEGEVKK